MRRWLRFGVGGAVIGLGVAAAVILGNAAQARGSKTLSYARVTAATAADPMQTVTPYQLGWMHVYLSTAPPSPAISASQAVQALEQQGIRDNGGPILETVLATCSMTPGPTTAPVAWANRPCWVLSIKPHTFEVWPPPGSDQPPQSVTPTVEIALVDANTGEVFSESSGTPPAQEPTQP